jgi:transcriptional regulator with XRE-family HTH domain
MDVVLVRQRLREIRKRCGLTQEQLSERANLSKQFISDLERGTKGFSMESFLRYVRGLGISPGIVFYTEGLPLVSLSRLYAQLPVFKQKILVDIFLPSLIALVQEIDADISPTDPMSKRYRS